MWFKNARLYYFTEPFELTPDELETKLANFCFEPCSSRDKSTLGWVSPLPREEHELDPEEVPMLTHTVADYIMICAQKQERILPASVIKEATEEKIAELEQRQDRKIYRKEQRQIKDEMFVTLLPRAFTRNQQIFAYFSPRDRLLVVNTPSAPKAEELLALLRDSLGSLPVVIPDTARNPGDVMTRWLKDQRTSDHFQLEEDCELYNPLDGSNVVRCKGQDLASEEIQTHLKAGKQIKSLGVSWNSLLSCTIVDDLTVKQLKFEGMKEETADEEIESATQKFDQEFAVMTLELSNFFKSLFSAFGGLQEK